MDGYKSIFVLQKTVQAHKGECYYGYIRSIFLAVFCSPKQSTRSGGVCVCVCCNVVLHIPGVPHTLALTSFTTLTNQCPVLTTHFLWK